MIKCTVTFCHRPGQWMTLCGPMCSPFHALKYEDWQHGKTSHEARCSCRECKAWRQKVGGFEYALA